MTHYKNLCNAQGKLVSVSYERRTLPSAFDCTLSHRRNLLRVVATILYLLSVSGTAWAGPPRLIVGFDEKVNPEVAVGGVYLVGFMYGSTLPEANSREMYVWIPAGSFEWLCVEVRSVDAQYTANARFDISETRDGAYVLAFRAEERKLVASYQPGELVLDGRVGRDCNTPEALTHVAMGWDAQPSTDHLLFFVNTDGHDAVVQLPLRSNNEQVRSIECQAIPTDRPRRVFSAYCMVEQPVAVDLSKGWLELRYFGEIVVWEELDVADIATP